MTRNLYGSTPSDVTFNADTGALAPNAQLQVYDARTGGTRITDLQTTEGSDISVVTSDSHGAVSFLGPDDDYKKTLWGDGGTGARVALFPVVTNNVATARIEDLSNVSTQAPLAGQLMQWNGSMWRPYTLPPFDGGGGGGTSGFAGVQPAAGDWFNLANNDDLVQLEQNELIAFPVYIGDSMDIDAFATSVAVAAAGASVRVGIYDENCATLIAELGTTSAEATGSAASTPTTAASVDGLIYAAIVLQGADGVQICAVQGWTLPTASSAVFGQQAFVHDGSVTGALPGTFVKDGTTTGPVPAIGFRRTP